MMEFAQPGTDILRISWHRRPYAIEFNWLLLLGTMRAALALHFQPNMHVTRLNFSSPIWLRSHSKRM
jgi:hypothetical protein